MGTLRGAGGSSGPTLQDYGSGSSLDTGQIGYPGLVIPSSGGLGLRCMLAGSNSSLPSCWVLQNGAVYGPDSGGGIAQIFVPEPLVGVFTSDGLMPLEMSDILGAGVSGSVYNLEEPLYPISTLPIKPEFCGFIVESAGDGLDPRGAFYISGEGKAYRYAVTSTWVSGTLQTVAIWNQVALRQVKPGTPNTPLPFDNLSVLYSGVAS